MAQKQQKKVPAKQPKAPHNKPQAKAGDNKWLWIAAILVLTYIAFYPSLKAEFTNWDDNVYIQENPLITKLSGDNIKKIFSTENAVSLNYHPLTILSFALDYNSVKYTPFRYHFVNLLLHLLNTLLVFFFVYRLSRQKVFVAIFTSLFFAIHPMHVESVAWVAERKDVLYTFFFLAGLTTYLLYSETKKLLYIVLTFALFVLSVLSKAMAVVFPMVLLLIDYYRDRKINLKVIAEKIPFLAVSAWAGLLAIHIQSRSAIAAYNIFSLTDRLSFGFYGYITYIWKMFLPMHLSAFYPYPITSISGSIPLSFYLTALAGALLFLAIVVFSFVKKDKMKLITFGMGFFFITIVMVLQFLSVGQVIMADRYSYIPYIGLLFTIGMMLNNYIQKKPALKTPALMAVLALGLVFSFITYGRTQVWKNSETMWTDVQQKYPFPPWKVEVAFENRGNYYAKEQYMLTPDHALLDKGLADYNVLLQMKTQNHSIFKNIGNIYGLKGMEYAKEGDTARAREYTDKAIAAYDSAIVLKPTDPDMYINLAITYAQTNRHELAAYNYGKAIALLPDDITLVERQGLSYFNDGKIKEAQDCFFRQAERDPQNPSPVYNISVCYDRLGDKANALTYALKAKQMGHPVTQQYLDELRIAAK